MKNFVLIAAIISVFALGACESFTNAGWKEKIGAGTGAVLGGIAGSQVGGGNGRLVATGVGALLGTLVGSEIGKSLDNADKAYAQSANQRAHAVPVGQTVQWNNPDSGNSGAVTARRDGHSSSGRYCREYEQSITVDGRAQTAVGTACQNPDGTWEVLNS